MNHKADQLSDAERVVIQAIASLPHLINDVPRPYSLKFLATFSEIGQKKIHSALRRLDLTIVLSENPEEAIERATALLPLALQDRNLVDVSSTFALE